MAKLCGPSFARSSGAAGPEDSGARERESGATVAGDPEHAAVARGEEEEDRDAVVGRPY